MSHETAREAACGTMYDLIVIGAGPGGYEAAFEAADLGLKTALVEKDEAGGTCLNHGCIPTKALLHAAELYQSMKEAEPLGIHAGELSYDLEKMQARKRDVVLQLRRGIADTARRKKVDLIRGVGTVCGEGRVLVRPAEGERPAERENASAAEEGRMLTGKNILLATGSRPALPPIEGIGLEGVVTSDELLENSEPIGRLVIIGGGVIGVEFAMLYQALDTKVTVIEAMPQLLPNLDRELSQSLKMTMKKRGIEVLTGARVEKISADASGALSCDVSAAQPAQAVTPVAADRILVCVGRRPNTENLFAEEMCPAMEKGRILVNEDYETSLPGVYAIGDVTGGVMLAHAATAEGRRAVGVMARKAKAARPEGTASVTENNANMPDIRFIPSCIYTRPEIACIGMTLEEAKRAGLNADSRKVLMGANGKTVIAGGERGYIRVVFEKETEKMLGAQLMCERATDLISEFTQALSAGLTLSDMARVIRPHPTFSEAITEAVRL